MLFDGAEITEYMLTAQALLPFSGDAALTVSTFLCGAQCSVCWTEKSALDALDRLAALSDAPLRFGRGFAPVGTRARPPFYTGEAFELLRGADAALTERTALLMRQIRPGARIAPAYRVPDRLLWDLSAPFCPLAEGSLGVRVCALQSALFALSFYPAPPSGVFDRKTRRALCRFLTAQGLPPDAAVGEGLFLRLLRLTSARI